MRWHWMDSIDPPLLNQLLVLVVLTWLPNDDIQMKGSHKSSLCVILKEHCPKTPVYPVEMQILMAETQAG